MSTDTAHTLMGSSALLLLAAGAWLAWGPGYSLLIVGGTILAGVIYARL